MALIIAHRGASGYRPEHSRSAYRIALSLGADAVEPDVVLSRDGVPVLRHESNLLGSTDVAERPEFAERRRTGRIDGEEVEGFFTEDFDWAELRDLHCREPRPELRPDSAEFNDRDRVLRLGELLDLLDAHEAERAGGAPVRLVIELKQSSDFARLGLDLPGAVERELLEYGWALDDERLLWESFEPEALRGLRAPGPKILLLEHSPGALDLDLAEEWAGLSVDLRRLRAQPELAAALHERGKLLFAWTARAENAFLPREFRGDGGPAAWGEWRGAFAALLASGIDGLFVDQPDLGLIAHGDVFGGI